MQVQSAPAYEAVGPVLVLTGPLVVVLKGWAPLGVERVAL